VSDVRFIIITVPPADVAVRLERARQEASILTASRSALAYPPHVTLRTGAMVPADSIGRFAAGIRTALGPWRPFPVRAGGLMHSVYSDQDGLTRHIVGWHIVADESLLRLHRALLAFRLFQRRAQPPFEPHLTLAFEDLEEAGAELLLQHAARNPDTFPPDLCWTCDRVGLFREIDDSWEPYFEFHATEGP
jgi:2'-5' RNA ligase